MTDAMDFKRTKEISAKIRVLEIQLKLLEKQYRDKKAELNDQLEQLQLEISNRGVIS